MTGEKICLPGGWGWPTGHVVYVGDAAVMLPELPMLRLLKSADRNAVLAAELSRLPALRQVRQRDVEKKYELPKSTANVVLTRARCLSA